MTTIWHAESLTISRAAPQDPPGNWVEVILLDLEFGTRWITALFIYIKGYYINGYYYIYSSGI